MTHSDPALYRRVLRHVGPYWRHIVAIFLLSLLATPLALLVPVPLKIVVDHVIGTEPLPDLLSRMIPATFAASKTSLLVFAAGMMIGVALLIQLRALSTTLLRTYTGEKLTLAFRSRIFEHVQRLSFSYHDSRGSTDSLYRIQYDAPSVQNIAIDGFIPFIASMLTLSSIVYVTARLDWQLALVALAVSPVLFILTQQSRRQLRSRSREVKELESSALGVVQEVLTSLRVVKAFGQEDREQERYIGRSREGMWARIRLAGLESGLGVLIGLTTAVGTAAVLFIGARSVQAGSITLGELLLMMTYLGQIYEPLKTISKRVASLQSQFASAERAFTLLDEIPEVAERSDARPISRARGQVVVEGVSFRYDPRFPILEDISFSIPAGTRVGLAGRTGAGKTTLMNLLTRFYDPAEGRILLDGVDLRDYKLADLRNQFSVVLQDAVLFSTSIAENIGYARQDATEEEIFRAARAANADAFIAQLPEGYDTLVGERGMRLSGGERQRIALARAFLRDSPILILDEPTSSVDMRTEAGIVDAVERLMHGRTTFMISHRLTTLRSCDLLLVLEAGRIVEATTGVSEAIQCAIALAGHEHR